VKVLHNPPKKRVENDNIILTIGYFDGVHLGHQELFKKVHELKTPTGLTYALTFENHPSTVINPQEPTLNVITPEHKIQLLKQHNFDFIIQLPFTKATQETSADEFLAQIYETLPFTHLVLGPDATIGKDKKGDTDMLKLLSKKYGFTLIYIPPLVIDELQVSSSYIRELIKMADFKQVERLLGRKYSIFSQVIRGDQRGRCLGFPTANIVVDNLTLPPFGVYKVFTQHLDRTYLSIANIGKAPTVKYRVSPLLEVHILDEEIDLYDQSIEVIYDSFIREEQKFESLDHLKKQISRDLQAVATSSCE
jgi:riboflavin kinase/FMN adenylyltransferase